MECSFSAMHSNGPGLMTWICWTHRKIVIDHPYEPSECADHGKPAVADIIPPLR